jgi:molybdopterin molybdotransferase
MNMIEIEEALRIILEQRINIEIEQVPIELAQGRILAENIDADRDFPPFDRVTMDGIAIDFEQYKNGQTFFETEHTHTAGSSIYSLKNKTKAVEVMTGAVLPIGTNCVIRYEDLEEKNNGFEIRSSPNISQNIHRKGIDKKAGEILISSPVRLEAMQLAVAATVGKANISVYSQIKVAIISTGDELVGIDEPVLEHQIRRSNAMAIEALIKPYTANVTLFHLIDDKEELKNKLAQIVDEFQVLILSGGVSMGKKDFVPDVLAELGLKKLFHKIKQKPGKPMWFGVKGDKTVFALPGNPTSTIVCTVKYVLPWLVSQYGLKDKSQIKVKLKKTMALAGNLGHFVQANLMYLNAEIWAVPVMNNGSGDFANLSKADGFLAFPIRENGVFEVGEVLDFILF